MTTKIEPLNVRIFKLMGWTKVENYHCWAHPDYDDWVSQVPDLYEDAQLMIDWLVPFMREVGYIFEITNCTDPSYTFGWYHITDRQNMFEEVEVQVEDNALKLGNNVAKAACEAAILILEKLFKEIKNEAR